MLRPRILSLTSLLAVSRMMGTLLSSRIFAVAAMPSMPGIMMSIKISWMFSLRTTSTASCPV